MFENTGDIYIDNSDNIYVTDFNGRVQKFSHQGVFLMKFGGSGSEIGQLESPAGIVVNAAGDIYVSDWGNNRIEKFNSQGAYITHWGSTFASPGSGPGEFNGPEGLALDAAGNLYVADHGNQRIQIFGY
jgi:DNA-binding beta-propeller fold protein YncE